VYYLEPKGVFHESYKIQVHVGCSASSHGQSVCMTSSALG